jgi:hypothetical protein
VVARNADGRLELFAFGTGDYGMNHIWQTEPNDSWSEWETIGEFEVAKLADRQFDRSQRVHEWAGRSVGFGPAHPHIVCAVPACGLRVTEVATQCRGLPVDDASVIGSAAQVPAGTRASFPIRSRRTSRSSCPPARIPRTAVPRCHPT